MMRHNFRGRPFSFISRHPVRFILTRSLTLPELITNLYQLSLGWQLVRTVTGKCEVQLRVREGLVQVPGRFWWAHNVVPSLHDMY